MHQKNTSWPNAMAVKQFDVAHRTLLLHGTHFEYQCSILGSMLLSWGFLLNYQKTTTSNVESEFSDSNINKI